MEKKTRILIVDDNPDDQFLLSHMLQKARLAQQVEIRADGREALEYLTQIQIDQLVAVFLDLGLPSIDGLQLLQQIRSDSTLRHVPVIVMTSSNSPQDLERCRRLGVTCYVNKPITIAAFTQAIANSFHVPVDPAELPRSYRSSEE